MSRATAYRFAFDVKRELQFFGLKSAPPGYIEAKWSALCILLKEKNKAVVANPILNLPNKLCTDFDILVENDDKMAKPQDGEGVKRSLQRSTSTRSKLHEACNSQVDSTETDEEDLEQQFEKRLRLYDACFSDREQYREPEHEYKRMILPPKFYDAWSGESEVEDLDDEDADDEEEFDGCVFKMDL
jgi:hypothetical protein